MKYFKYEKKTFEILRNTWNIGNSLDIGNVRKYLKWKKDNVIFESGKRFPKETALSKSFIIVVSWFKNAYMFFTNSAE